jgi:Flp pilus assembly protein TadB
VKRRGLKGAVAGWFADTSANIGGPKAMRLLFAISLVVGLGVAFVILAIARPPVPTAVAIWLGSTLGAFLIVRGEMRRRWMIAFLDLLVEAVELLTRSVRAGYAVPAAIRMVGKEIQAPVGPVFARIADEDDLGIEMRQALRNAAQRVALPDFTFLAIAMVIQRETGGQLGDSLDNLHMVLRKRKEARLKVQALTAEGRMSANIVGAIPFVAGGGVYMLNPEQTMRLFEPGLGQTMLFGAGAMLGIGLVIVRWIVKAQP